MKKIALFFCLLSAFFMDVPAQRVTVNVAGIKEARGNVLIGVYDSPVNFAKAGSQIRLVSVPAVADSVSVTISGLKEGEYAFTVLHDKNANGKCDYNLLGIPKESFGFSNNVKPKLKAPSFNDVKVYVGGDIVLTIKLFEF